MNSESGSSDKIVVVGAGIIGLSVALKLENEGYAVTLIDSQDPMQGCSAGNAGFLSQANIFPPATTDILLKLPKLLYAKEGPLVIAPSYLGNMLPWTFKAAATLNRARFNRIVDAFSSLMTRAQASLQQLAATADALHFLSQEGGLICFLTEKAFNEKKLNVPIWRAKGISVEVLDSQATRALEPGITDKIVGSIFFENSGRCNNPQGLGLSYFRYLQSRRVPFIKEAVVALDKKREGGWVVTTATQKIAAQSVVLCAGYHSENLLKELGYKRHVASERGYHLMLPAPGVVINRPVVFGEPYFAATPMEQGLRLAGTAEFCAPDKPENMKRATMLKELASKYLPGLDAKNAVPWMGIRPTLPDGLPAIGELPDSRGLFYAFGHGHNGLMTSAITAECISALIASGNPPVDIRPFNLARFN